MKSKVLMNLSLCSMVALLVFSTTSCDKLENWLPKKRKGDNTKDTIRKDTCKKRDSFEMCHRVKRCNLTSIDIEDGHSFSDRLAIFTVVGIAFDGCAEYMRFNTNEIPASANQPMEVHVYPEICYRSGFCTEALVDKEGVFTYKIAQNTPTQVKYVFHNLDGTTVARNVVQ